MKLILGSILSLFCLSVVGLAEEPTELPSGLSPAQIETLVSPIALYPDPLVALILPAATRSSEIVLAARFLARGGLVEAVGGETWQESVKALTRYPEIVTYLDENLAWTQTLGDTFLAQGDAVMDAIQAVRARARINGLLTDTDEQKVLVEGGEICIVPARPTVLYVPRYDPEVLYVSYAQPYYPGTFISFGLGYSIGSWLNYDCDWRHRRVGISHHSPVWNHDYNWRARRDYRHTHGRIWRDWTPGHHHRRPDHGSPAVANPVLRPQRSLVHQNRAETESEEQDRDRREDRAPRSRRERPTVEPSTSESTTVPRSRAEVTTSRGRPTTTGSRSRAPTVTSTPVVAAPIPEARSVEANSRRSGGDRQHRPQTEVVNVSDRPRMAPSAPAAPPAPRPQPTSQPESRAVEADSTEPRSDSSKQRDSRFHKPSTRANQSEFK